MKSSIHTCQRSKLKFCIIKKGIDGIITQSTVMPSEPKINQHLANWSLPFQQEYDWTEIDSGKLKKLP